MLRSRARTCREDLVAAILASSCATAGRAAAQDFGVGGQQKGPPSLTQSRLGLESSWAGFDAQGAQGARVQGDYYDLACAATSSSRRTWG